MKLKSKKKASALRRWVQIALFALIAVIAINHTLEASDAAIPWLSTASLHAVCPFGGVVSIYQVFSNGTFTKKIHESSFVLMGIVFFLAIAFGPVFCGWICPMGSIQEWTGKLGKKIFGKTYNGFIPAKVDRWLRYLRYLVLAWVIYMTAVTGKLSFEAYDPYAALFSFWTSEVSITGLVILLVVLALSLFVERPFCKYACPYGAVLGVSNLFRVFAIKRNPATCIDCKACDKSCPMNINVSGAGTVRDHQCISCLQCTTEVSCPKPETVELAAGNFVKQIRTLQEKE